MINYGSPKSMWVRVICEPCLKNFQGDQFYLLVHRQCNVGQTLAKVMS